MISTYSGASTGSAWSTCRYPMPLTGSGRPGIARSARAPERVAVVCGLGCGTAITHRKADPSHPPSAQLKPLLHFNVSLSVSQSDSFLGYYQFLSVSASFSRFLLVHLSLIWVRAHLPSICLSLPSFSSLSSIFAMPF